MALSRRWLAIVSVFSGFLACSAAGAQTCNATAPTANPTCNESLNATVTVQHLLQLTVAGGAQTNLNPPLVAQYDSSSVASTNDQQPYGATGPIVTVKANRGWQLNVKAGAAYWTFSPDVTYQLCRPGGGTYSSCTGSSNATAGKPAGDLFWSLNNTSSFNPLLVAGQNFASNVVGSAASYTIYFRVKWSYGTDVPGTYTIPVVYTVTGQ